MGEREEIPGILLRKRAPEGNQPSDSWSEKFPMFLKDKKLPLESKEMKDQRLLSQMGEIKKKKKNLFSSNRNCNILKELWANPKIAIKAIPNSNPKKQCYLFIIQEEPNKLTEETKK